MTPAGRYVRAAMRHWPILVILVPAAGLRALAWLAVHPAWWILGDSIDYVAGALHIQPGRWRPSGYSLLVLKPRRDEWRASGVGVVVSAGADWGGAALIVLRLRREAWSI
jgi:hypothetical protein